MNEKIFDLDEDGNVVDKTKKVVMYPPPELTEEFFKFFDKKAGTYRSEGNSEMTIDRALEILNDDKVRIDIWSCPENITDDDWYDALYMAIQALQILKDHQQLITKQSVIDFYNTQFPDLNDGVHWSRNDIIQNLDCIEPIEINICEGGKNENTKSN